MIVPFQAPRAAFLLLKERKPRVSLVKWFSNTNGLESFEELVKMQIPYPQNSEARIKDR